jgi:hypothetical protein
LEVDVQQGNFKILRLLPQVLILFLVEKWIPPSRSKTAEIGQKIEGILRVKLSPQTRFKGFFQKEMPSVPVKYHFSYLSLH